MSDGSGPVSKSALASMTLQGAAAMVVAYAAARVGLQLGEGATQVIAQGLIDLVFALGAMAVSIGRARAKGPLH